MTVCSTMTSERMVTKNTFLHFEDEIPELPDGLIRAQSCPNAGEFEKRRSDLPIQLDTFVEGFSTPSDMSGSGDASTIEQNDMDDIPAVPTCVDRYITEDCEPGRHEFEDMCAKHVMNIWTPELNFSIAESYSEPFMLPEAKPEPVKVSLTAMTPPPTPPMPPIPKAVQQLEATPRTPTTPTTPNYPAPQLPKIEMKSDEEKLQDWLAQGRVTHEMVQRAAAAHSGFHGPPPHYPAAPPPYPAPRPHPYDLHAEWHMEEMRRRDWARWEAERWGPGPWDRPHYYEGPRWEGPPAWDMHHDWFHWADRRPQRREPVPPEVGVKVFVGGLGPFSTSQTLRDYFAPFGRVLDAAVLSDGQTKRSRGFGFVEFAESIPEGLLDREHIIDERRCGVRKYNYDPTAAPSQSGVVSS